MVVDRLLGTLHGELFAAGGSASDADLLTRFIERRDEPAFASLVHRHGRMVLGVCYRVLRNAADAEDAFQAAFLVLARKAASVRPRHSLGNWLYGVAHRTAREAKRAATRRRAREHRAVQMTGQRTDDADRAELQALLDQELSQLPDKYREPIVLCDLEGLTRKAAAHRLGCPEGTLSVRLFRGRALLARRLARHGLTATGVAVAAASGTAAPSPQLLATTVEITFRTAASTRVVVLAEGVRRAMMVTKLKALGAGMLVVCLTLGTGAVAWWTAAAQSASPTEGSVSARDTAEERLKALEQDLRRARTRLSTTELDAEGLEQLRRLEEAVRKLKGQGDDRAPLGLVLRQYPIKDLLGEHTATPSTPELLTLFITRLIAPETWEGTDARGPRPFAASIRYSPADGTLAVVQTDGVHDQIADLLRVVRTKPDPRRNRILYDGLGPTPAVPPPPPGQP